MPPLKAPYAGLMKGHEMSDSTSAFNHLFSHLVETIMSTADSPGQCARYLAENLRSLIGAKTVLVLECTHSSGLQEHRILSAFPSRRAALGMHEAVQEIATLSHRIDRTNLVLPGNEAPLPIALNRLEVGASLISPLVYAGERVGVLLLLDLMDTDNLGTIRETLDKLSTVLALILRNAFLYNNLESEVVRRTRELTERSAALAKALNEKDVMLKEVHHRVKNNLQLVNSLLYLQAASSDDPVLRNALEIGQGRIYSMSLVHEELYRSDDLASVDMQAYVQRLCMSFSDNAGERIRIGCTSDAIHLPVTQSVPCGLILNELITNALKYAYPESTAGEIAVTVRQDGGTVTMVVEDGGVGLPEDSKMDTFGSLGLTLVRGLVDQLHGQLDILGKSGSGMGERGVRIEIHFPWESIE